MAPSPLALDLLLVVSCTFSVVLAIVYLFYSNRILALIVGYFLRLRWWDEGSNRSWVSLESFQVSLLAGRIMIKDLRYHSSNQTFRAIKCSVTWRYWIWRTRSDFSGPRGEDEDTGNSKSLILPCRIHVALEGVEWLLYNRTAAYDDILARLQHKNKQCPHPANGHSSPVSDNGQGPAAFASDGGNAHSKKSATVYTENSGSTYRYPPSLAHPLAAQPRLTRAKEALFDWFAAFKPEFHEILPIGITARHGAIVCGNSSTPSTLVAMFSRAEGSYGIVMSRSLLDKYKTVIDLRFQNVKFDLEKNGKYRGSLVQHGRAVSRRLESDPVDPKLSFTSFTRSWTDQKRQENQYKTDDVHARIQAEQEQQSTSDYAMAETILEAPELELSYYWDEPGVVPPALQKAGSEGLESYNVGNHDLAPQYGIDFTLHGGTVRYGPWADRQRVELQRLFFPPTYQNAEATPPLKPGDVRVYTALKVFIELRDTTTFHIPFKEPSKDWQFDEAKFPGSTRRRREGGWIEAHTCGNSTINYILPWIATEEGYDTLLELHLDQVTMLSSVNDIEILTAESSRILCQLPTPLGWNDSRQWTFDVSFRRPTIYILRDHINLFTDLGKDWSSGPPSDYDRWIPMHYIVNTSLQDFELNLFLNDHNIITHPHARDANTLLTMRGASLRNSADLPSTVFRPQHTIIPFWIEALSLDFSLTLPKWNTHSQFATSRINNIGRVGLLRADASFLFYADTRPEYIDHLKLELFAHEVVFICFGWVIRHLMSVRDNYFGAFTHFSTLSEYVTKRHQNQPVGDPVEWKWREGKSNVFEVSLGVRVQDSVIVLPAGFPGYEYALDYPTEPQRGPTLEPKGLGTSVILLQPELQVNLRTHDYSMEMSLNISPVATSVVENLMHSLIYESYRDLGRQKLKIDGINIIANRLFGPQPKTSTYLCLWELDIGAVTGVVSTMELRGLIAAITSFRHNFSDDVNAPASEFAIPPEPDVTFLKFTLRSMDVAWMADQICLHMCLPQGIKLDYTDLAGQTYKKVIEVRIPEGVLRAMICSVKRWVCWLEAGSVSFDVGMDIYSSPRGWREAAQYQTTFVAAQDALTRRAWFLYEDSSANHGSLASSTYHSTMFLPRPKLPKHAPRRTSMHSQAAIPQVLRKPRRRPILGTVKKADSDSEGPISEADRDARLAYSRPTTPLMFNNVYDDRNMSSSDESDNGDNTSDLSDSDSDSPENDEESKIGDMSTLPLLAHYRNIVRRFESNPVSWKPSLFRLVRDISPALDDSPSTSVPPAISSWSYGIQEQVPDENTSSTVRLVRSNSFDVLITPLCLHVVRQVSEEIFNLNSSLELLVDSLTMRYLSDTPKDHSPRISQDTFNIEVLALRVRILQSLMAVDETLAAYSLIVSPANAPPVSPSNSRIVSDVQISLQDLRMSFSETAGSSASPWRPNVTSRASFSRVKAQLNTSVQHTLPQMNRTRKVTNHCTFEMDESETAYTLDDLHMTLGNVRAMFHGKTSPEMAVATADSLASVIQGSQAAYNDRAKKNTARKQYLLWNSLQACRGMRLGDPLTQTQPSFLVQLGRPLRLRLDVSWKLFMYLRYSLRYLDPRRRQTLLSMQATGHTTRAPVRTDDLCAILAEVLSEWGHEMDRDEMGNLPFIRYCFSPEKQSPPKKPNLEGGHVPAVSFHSGNFSFAVFEEPMASDDKLGNTLTLGPLHIAYRDRRQKMMLPSGKSSGAGVVTLHADQESRSTRRHVLTAVVEDIHITIHPTFITFLQRLLLLHGRYFRQRAPPLNPSPSSTGHVNPMPNDYWECFIEAPMVSIQAAVESMVLEVGLAKTSIMMPLLQTTAHTRLARIQRDISGNCSLKFSEFYTRVREARDKTDPFRSNGRDILTSVLLSSLAMNVGYRILEEHPPIIRGVLTMGSALLSVPRSALLTYRLIGEWRTQYLPNIHAMAHDLFTELEKRQKRSKRSKPRSSLVLPVLDIQVRVKRVGVSLQVMHGTWFSWDVNDVVVLLRNAPGATRCPRCTFGVQLASQLIRIGAQSDEDGGTALKTIKLALPSFRTSGNYDGVRLRSHAIIDHFSLTLKPRYMDDILVVQQNLGTHFYDVLDLVAESRRNRPTHKRTATAIVKYNVAFMLQGFRVGIEGPTTTLDLTSAQMTGTAKNENGLAWDFAVSNLALALSHHSHGLRPRTGFDRKFRSAYMVLDLKASSSPVAVSGGGLSSHLLRLRIGRLHAVMSPNSIGELGDLIDHVQAEKHLRQDQRALELEEMKNKTKRVMRTFEVQKPTASFKRSTSLLDNRTVLIDIADIGVAFPLALKDEIEVDAVGSVPAFLMSIRTATFSIKRYESGHASMGRLSFQFVKQFDQSRPSQFDGDHHQSHNKLLYPGMQAEFQSGTSTTTRQWQIGAYVDGFILDLDPSIVDNVFGLVDVYHKGRERVDRLTRVPDTAKIGPVRVPDASIEASYLAIRTSNILVTLVFHTGKLRFQRNHIQADTRSTQDPELIGSPTPSIVPGELEDDDADVIHFPTITVWGEYKATPAVSKVSSTQEQEPSVLIFRSQVHATSNQINPTLFPFLTGFMEKIGDRLRQPEAEPSPPDLATPEVSEMSTQDSREFLTSGVLNGIQLSFSLRIDSSQLELACGPGIGVVAALRWESGGFLVTLSPKSRVAHFAGSVTGLQVDLRHLKHQGGAVQTAEVDARNLAFSVSYSQTDDEEGLPAHSISVVLDTEFGAGLRLDRLQDILIFKAIYIDRLPGTVPQASVKPGTVTGKVPQGRIQGLTTVILARARHIKLVVDLGHNVAAAVTNMESLVLRSRMAGSVTHVSLSIAQTSLDLEDDRPLSGFMRLPDFSFTTARRSDVQLGMKDSIPKMLDVALTSGTLDIVLQYEKRPLLQYHAKPFDIRISDDWSAIDWNLPPEDRTLRLDFSVAGTEILAVANLQTIPKIIVLLAKLRTDLEVQRTEARHSLTIPSIAQLPKPENALSEVADAMIRSARSKFSDGPTFSYVIVQHMRLRLSNLRLTLFKNPNDTEMALFEGRDVHAELQRVVQALDMPPSRTLKLAFSSLHLSKYSSLKYRVAEDDLLATTWLHRLLKGANESTIARVPAMDLEMNSDVEYEDRQEVLLYDLVATADGHIQRSTSIYVSLNLSLYIWAGALVKGLGVEIDKALVASGLNTPAVRAAAAVIASPPSLPVDELQAKPSETRTGLSTTPSHPIGTIVTAESTAGTSPTTHPLPSANTSGARLPRKYHARSETSIDYGTIQQLGEATPDAKAPWLGLKETVPPRVHEYATLPMEVLMKTLLEIYSKQLRMATKRKTIPDMNSETDVRAGTDRDGNDCLQDLE